MFFDVEILCNPQGKFFLIWTAGTRGVKCITNAQIKKINIIYSCEELIKIINTDSIDVSHRFSLRLSAQLLSGITRIYKRQVELFYQKVLSVYLHSSHRPEIIPVETDSNTESIIVARRIPRKKKATVQLPEDVPVIEEPVRPIDESEITMVEAPIQVQDKQPDLEDYLGSIVMDVEDAMNPDLAGIIPDFSDLLAEIPNISRDIQSSRTKEIPQLLQPPELPMIIEDITIIPQEIAVDETNVPQEIPMNVDAPTEEPAITHLVEPEVPAIQIAAATPAVLQHAFKKLTPKRKPIGQRMDQLYIHIKKSKVRNINLDIDRDFKYNCRTDEDMPDIKFTNVLNPRLGTVADNMIEEMLNMGQDRPAVDDTSNLKVGPNIFPRTPSVQDVDSMLKTSLSVTALGRSINLEQLPISHSTPLRAASPRLLFGQMIDQTLEEPAPPCAQIQRVAGSVITVVADVHQSLHGDAGPAPPCRLMDIEEVPIEPHVSSSLDIAARAHAENTVGDIDRQREKRLEDLIERIKKVHNKGIVPITLDDVALKPLNKLSVATTFNDLLYLCKKRYVDLVPECQSLELNHLELGPKLKEIN